MRWRTGRLICRHNEYNPAFILLSSGGSFAPWLRCEHRCFSLMIFMGSVLLSTWPAILNKTVRIKFQQKPNNFNDRSKQVHSSTQLPGINNNIKFHRMLRLAKSRTILVKKKKANHLPRQFRQHALERFGWHLGFCWRVFVLYVTVCSPNIMSTLRGCCGRSKDRCLIRVLHLASGFFPVNSRINWLLCDVHVHVDCTGSRKVCAAGFAWYWPAAFYLKILAYNVALLTCLHVQGDLDCAGSRKLFVCPGLGARHFTGEFSHKVLLWALVCIATAQACAKSATWAILDLRQFTWEFSHKILTCPCAFRLCRLAQNGFPGLGAWPFPANSCKKTGSCDISMCILTAQTRAKSLTREISLIFVCGIVLENFRIKWLLWHVHVHFVWAGLHKTVVAVLGVTFSWKFLHKTARGFCQMSTMHFDFAGLLTTAVPVLGPVLPQTVWPLGAPSGFRLCSCKFLQKVALVWCPRAFRLCRIAQTLPHEFCFKFCMILVCGILPESSIIQKHVLFWYVDVHVDCAGTDKAVVPVLGRGIFPVNSHTWAISCGDPAKFLSQRSLHDPVQVLNRRSCGDPGEILS